MKIAIQEFPNTLSEDFCNEIIDLYHYHEHDIENRADLATGSVKDLAFVNKKDSWKHIDQKVMEAIRPKINSYLEQLNLGIEDYVHCSSALMCHQEYYSLPFHADLEVTRVNEEGKRRHFGCLVYLNGDFDGGELMFPLQDLLVKPTPGKFIIFPMSFMYPHGTLPSFGSDRYVYRLNFHCKEEEVYW